MRNDRNLKNKAKQNNELEYPITQSICPLAVLEELRRTRRHGHVRLEGQPVPVQHLFCRRVADHLQIASRVHGFQKLVHARHCEQYLILQIMDRPVTHPHRMQVLDEENGPNGWIEVVNITYVVFLLVKNRALLNSPVVASHTSIATYYRYRYR